ncbi:hypothetical protein Glove_276g68 [Diversispora epigaea]|uniref:Uncharacterized protein n=1 Tax=Diversispora epigaea TaxID=1348612 RepID=A0A397I2R4_9GLOM|nr:hypothetical protein Glove_276g68 [Diversispora epigaea]
MTSEYTIKEIIRLTTVPVIINSTVNRPIGPVSVKLDTFDKKLETFGNKFDKKLDTYNNKFDKNLILKILKSLSSSKKSGILKTFRINKRKK